MVTLSGGVAAPDLPYRVGPQIRLKNPRRAFENTGAKWPQRTTDKLGERVVESTLWSAPDIRRCTLLSKRRAQQRFARPPGGQQQPEIAVGGKFHDPPIQERNANLDAVRHAHGVGLHEKAAWQMIRLVGDQAAIEQRLVIGIINES